jgi:hypothetical protein
MALLTDYTWATKYDSDTLSLIKEFYTPALNRAVRYDRSTGYFSARILTLAAIGIEGLIRVGELINHPTAPETEVIDDNPPLDLQEQFKQIWRMIQTGAALNAESR